VKKEKKNRENNVISANVDLDLTARFFRDTAFPRGINRRVRSLKLISFIIN